MRNQKIVTYVVAIIVLAGVAMRCYGMFMGRSLWEDEAHLALNFILFDFERLAKPLGFAQAAPIGFIYTVELATLINGFGEKTLRALPFFGSLAVMPIVFSCFYSFTRDRLASVLALAMYSLNLFLVYYSSELKPYTLEVSSYILLVWLYFTDQRWVARHRWLLLGIAGCIAPLYANTSVLVLFLLGLLMLHRFFTKGFEKKILFVLAAWAIVYGVNFFKFIWHHPYGPGMRAEWHAYFLPGNVFSRAFWEFLKLRVDDTFFSSLMLISTMGYFGWLLAALFVVGIGSLVHQRKWSVLLLTAGLVLLHLGASVFELYPFFFRFILYLMPALMILIGIGISVCYRFLAKKLHPAAGVALIVWCCFSLLYPSIKAFPIHVREIKPILKHIDRHYPDKQIMVTTPATVFEYSCWVLRVKNNKFRRVTWNITPEAYYEETKDLKSNYLLLHSSFNFDGYESVMKDLKEKGLVVYQLDTGTYSLTELKPYQPAIKDANRDSIKISKNPPPGHESPPR